MPPWTAAHAEAVGPDSSFSEAALKRATTLLQHKCSQGLYERHCPDCAEAHGHKRKCRRLSPEEVGRGVLSMDLSGPHPAAFSGHRYFLVANLSMPEGDDIPFSRLLKTKTTEEVARALTSVMCQIVSLAQGTPPVFRIHSDAGKEFTGGAFQREVESCCVWPTSSTPYTPQQNGKAERLVGLIKAAAGSLLLHAQLPLQLWSEAILEATFLRRCRALKLLSPKDRPRMGDTVLVRKPPLPAEHAFAPKAEEGIFLANDERSPARARVMVLREGVSTVRVTRLPVLQDKQVPRWKLERGPNDEVVWLSTHGNILWNAPPEDLITVEEATGQVQAWNTDNAASSVIRARFKDHMQPELLFSLFGHGFLVDSPELAVASGAAVAVADETKHDFLEGKRCWICHRTARECHQAKLDSIPPGPKGYQIDAADTETTADEIANLMAEVASMKASAETVDCRVFVEGTEEARMKWFNGAKAEMEGMREKGVLDELKRDSLRAELGLGPDERIPRVLPTKLVVSRKPEDGALESSQEPSKIEDPPWKAKCRLRACGNFEAEDGAEVSTQNVCPMALRIMGYQLSSHASWIGASGDVSLAFLNSSMDPSEIVLLEPPAILKRLKLVEAGTIWRARKHIYGLRRSPKAWSNLRDVTINKQVLDTSSGKVDVKLVPDEDGLFVLVSKASQKIVGIAATYVDDIFAVGEPSVVAAFMSFIQKTWTTKFSGFITRGDEQVLSHGDFKLSRVPELTFIGLQIKFDDQQKAVFHQRRWILSELHKRGWTHLCGTPSLPQIELDIQEPTEGSEYNSNLKSAQTELGCLLWICTKTRPDLLSTVSISASHLHKCPGQVLKVARGCWRYLRATLNVGLRFPGNSSCSALKVWSDASFSPEGSRSRSGGVITLGDCALGWWSSKQTVTAWSVCEAETDAMALAVSEVTKLLPLLECLTGQSFSLHVELYGDNSASITVINRETFFVKSWRTRAFALRAAWLRDQVQESGLTLTHHPGAELIADMLTKTLPKGRLAELRLKIGLT